LQIANKTIEKNKKICYTFVERTNLLKKALKGG
jgi:hypothetical protein